MGKTLTIFRVVLFVLATATPLFAQAAATLALRNGERSAGTLIDLSASGFTLRADGRDRRFDADEVATLEFLAGSPSPDVRADLERGRQVVVFRNGRILRGRLVSVGGAKPLRLTVETDAGLTDVSSDDVAQVFLNLVAAPVHGAPRGGDAPVVHPSRVEPNRRTSAVISVSANRAWTDTGLTVSRGESIAVSGAGTVMVSAKDRTGPEGSRSATSLERHYPVASALAGALIARVGNGTPFLVDGVHEVVMPNGGRLWLGVNDDDCGDNSGAYSVTITRRPR